MKSAIVTGAAGFMGSRLVRELLNNDISVTAVVRKNGKIDMFPNDERLQIVCCDMADYDRLAEIINPSELTVFYHLAWDGVYGEKRSDVKLQMENVIACQKAVMAASDIGCDKFIGIGSIMEREASAAACTNGLMPGTPYIYGAAKSFAHLVSKAEAAERKMPFIWAVVTNIYGEYDNSSRFINTTLHRIVNKDELNFSQGNQLYDFIYIGDAVKALRLIGEKGKEFHEYLIGSGNPKPLREYILELSTALSVDAVMNFGTVPYTGAEMSAELFSIDNLTEDTGFSPEMDFAAGIKRTMDWVKGSYDR